MLRDASTRGTGCQFVVAGELGDRFVSKFDGLEMRRCEGTTVLTAEILDSAQIAGVLAQIQELGLELLSFEQIKSQTEESE